MNRYKPSLVTILAEDKRHQLFARRYLYRLGFQDHDLREVPLLGGKGCGEQWVREQYAKEMKSYRARAARATSALVVVIDSDTNPKEKRVEQLRMELEQAGLNPRTANEQVVHLIPKRNIETWVLYLLGRDVNEEADYKQEGAIDSKKLKAAGEALFDLVHSNDVPPSDCPPSMRRAVLELKRLEY